MTPRPWVAETRSAVWVFAVPGDLRFDAAVAYVRDRLRECVRPDLFLDPVQRDRAEREVREAVVKGMPTAVRVIKGSDFRASDLGGF